MNIHTYPEMNETIKDLMRRSEEPMHLYIAARLEELEAAQPRWISVRERMPEIEQHVLVVDDRREVRAGCREPFGFVSGCRGKVTHWMPMPDPPQEER